MLKAMPAHVFAEWMAFDENEPIGQAWLQTGTIAAMIANVHIDPRKYDLMRPQEFIPGYAKPETQPEDVAGKVDAYFSALAASGTPLG